MLHAGTKKGERKGEKKCVQKKKKSTPACKPQNHSSNKKLFLGTEKKKNSPAVMRENRRNHKQQNLGKEKDRPRLSTNRIGRVRMGRGRLIKNDG